MNLKITIAQQLLQSVAPILTRPATHGHPDIPPIGRFVIDFDGYRGLTDFIGGDLYPAADVTGDPIHSDLAETLLNSPAIHPDGRETTLGEILDDAVEAKLIQHRRDWNEEEGAYGHLDIHFTPRLRIRGKITRRFISSRAIEV